MLLDYYQAFIIRMATLSTAIYLSVPTSILIIKSIILTLKHPESERLIQVEDMLIVLLPPTALSWIAYLALLYL